MGAQENGFCFQPGLPYFLMFVVTIQLLAVSCYVLVFVRCTVGGKFLLSVVGCWMLLIADTRLLGAVVCGFFGLWL